MVRAPAFRNGIGFACANASEDWLSMTGEFIDAAANHDALFAECLFDRLEGSPLRQKHDQFVMAGHIHVDG